jgi:hypothetical protein
MLHSPPQVVGINLFMNLLCDTRLTVYYASHSSDINDTVLIDGEQFFLSIRHAHPLLPQQLLFVLLDLGINPCATPGFVALVLGWLKWTLDSL